MVKTAREVIPWIVDGAEEDAEGSEGCATLIADLSEAEGDGADAA
jgi:hypothetical protein